MSDQEPEFTISYNGKFYRKELCRHGHIITPELEECYGPCYQCQQEGLLRDQLIPQAAIAYDAARVVRGDMPNPELAIEYAEALVAALMARKGR